MIKYEGYVIPELNEIFTDEQLTTIEAKGYTFMINNSSSVILQFAKDVGNTTRYLDFDLMNGTTDIWSQSNLKPSVIHSINNQKWIKELMGKEWN